MLSVGCQLQISRVIIPRKKERWGVSWLEQADREVERLQTASQVKGLVTG